jgi:hypothetical protein
MTSLPPHEALFHLTVKVGQRRKGASAVAKAAYDAAVSLMDRRQGRTCDYSRKKGVMSSIILAPSDAPGWAYDREALWNRVEATEARSDAVVWREVEVSLPRDIPTSSWQKLIEDACTPYISTGAICDISFHCPKAMDGAEQPHAHILMTTRAIDPESATGFAARKNTRLAAFFESGGRHGGQPGAALRQERERWERLLNEELRAVGSLRRTSSKSYRSRDIVDRVAEPKLGENRVSAMRRKSQKGHDIRDRRLHAVVAQRRARRAENDLLKTNMEMEKMRTETNAREQPKNVKLALLKERIPDLELTSLSPDLVHMVDVRRKDTLRVMMRDGSWVEFRNGRIIYWGGPGKKSDAARLASAIAAAEAIDDITYAPRSARGSRPGGTAETSPRAKASPQERADLWRTRGFTDICVDQDDVWVTLTSVTRLQDTGDAVYIHGDVSDGALRALALKAREEWDSQIELFGDDTFKQKAWLEMMRQGIEVIGYDPPESVRKSWFAEQHAKQQLNGVRAAIAGEAKVALNLKNAAKGDVRAIQALDQDLAAFLHGYAVNDTAAIQRLIDAETTNVVPELERFRYYGQAHRDPEATAHALRAWIVMAPGAPTPPCPAIAHLARHYASQGMDPDEIVVRLTKALRIADQDGRLRSAEETAAAIESHIEEATRNSEMRHRHDASMSHTR